MHRQTPMRRKTDVYDDSCPMTPKQIEAMLRNQEKLLKDVADLKQFLFAGRVVVGTLVIIGLTLDWTRDHLSFIKSWINSK